MRSFVWYAFINWIQWILWCDVEILMDLEGWNGSVRKCVS